MSAPDALGLTHRISDLSFREGWLTCRCGVRVEGVRPTDLDEAYQRHRVEVGLKLTFVGIGGHGRRAWEAWGFS